MRVGSALVISLVAACGPQPPVQAEVTHGVPSREMAVRLAPGQGRASVAIRRVSIHRADGRPGVATLRWAVTRRPGAPAVPLPVTIPFAARVRGYVALVPSQALEAGRYEVRVEVDSLPTTVLPFEITTAGLVR